jgi:carboxymethylenebutenolidase
MFQSQPQGFLAVPATGQGPGVLVLHAWWGLNDTIKAVCTRLAEAGFTTFAPDLYHGQTADTIPGAEALSQALETRFQQTRDEIAEAVSFLQEQARGSGIAAAGFSLGAFYALDLSVTAPEQVHSVVLFYGTGDGDFSRSRAAYLGHFAGEDPYEPEANLDDLEAALKKAGRPVTFYRYPGTGHWFFEADRSDAYNPEAANLAWERTLAFLKGASEG